MIHWLVGLLFVQSVSACPPPDDRGFEMHAIASYRNTMDPNLGRGMGGSGVWNETFAECEAAARARFTEFEKSENAEFRLTSVTIYCVDLKTGKKTLFTEDPR